MLKLVVIADDLTGALDTGIKFAEGGIKAQIITDGTAAFEPASDNEVLVVCLPTRHVTPDTAYEQVFRLAKRFVEKGVPYIYKKTDSVLRGNIGRELEAMIDAVNGKALPFVPAFPAMGRTTRDGAQFLHGEPIDETVFRTDPFNPVTDSNVKSIIHRQSEVSVQSIDMDALKPEIEDGQILVIDAETEEDLSRIAQRLDQSGLLNVTAGCAGFAEALRKIIGFKTNTIEPVTLSHPMVVACGSVNPVTQLQLEYAEEQGIKRMILSVKEQEKCRQHITKGYLNTAAEILESVKADESVIFGTDGLSGIMTALEDAEEKNKSKICMEEMISTVLKHLLDQKLEINLFVIGGDTLLAFLRKIGCIELRTECELSSGIVLSKFEYQEKSYQLLSKSGGFGNPEDLFQILKNSHCENTV